MGGLIVLALLFIAPLVWLCVGIDKQVKGAFQAEWKYKYLKEQSDQRAEEALRLYKTLIEVTERYKLVFITVDVDGDLIVKFFEEGFLVEVPIKSFGEAVSLDLRLRVHCKLKEEI